MKFIKKEVFPSFIKLLLKDYEVIAPVLDYIHKFKIIESPDEINLNFTNTLYPPKKFFLPHNETLFDYDKNKIKTRIKNKKRIIFGIRPCDVHSLLILDRFFEDKISDPFYALHRKNTLIFALNCSQGNEYCFCESLGYDKLTYGYDLLFTRLKDGFLVEIGSQKGESLTKKYFSETNKKPQKKHLCDLKLNTSKLQKLEEKFDDKKWEEESKACLSCGACVFTCPTCGCFTVEDFPDFDLTSGSRKRTWSTCQLKDFSKVAGNFVFREQRSRRFQHRIYHKFDYYPALYGENMCVGCGRCIRNCPPRIDMVRILNEL